MSRLKRSRTTVYNVTYHVIWCAKYRRKILSGDIESTLIILLNKKAIEIGIEIESVEVMPDHVHLFIRADPTIAIQYIVNQLKGYTSRILRSEFASVKSRLPSLWTRSYYVETIGHISEDAIVKYIENQKSV